MSDTTELEERVDHLRARVDTLRDALGETFLGQREVVDLVADRRPEAVVYVSCDPPTLGRDLARFATRGYRPDTVLLFDLFPDTFHLETVVRLLPA